jgi:hypothetical protein
MIYSCYLISGCAVDYVGCDSADCQTFVEMVVPFFSVLLVAQLAEQSPLQQEVSVKI